MPRLVLQSETQTRSFELKMGVNHFGRGAGCDFQLDHPTISSLHCELVVDGEAVRVRDCGSTNGTFVNGQQVGEAPLLLGQSLRLGDVELSLQPLPAVTIPHVDLSVPLPPPPLADGSPSCIHHGDRRASYQCSRCHKTFCTACIHELHRVGGHSHKLCPLCSAHCHHIAAVAKPKKKGLLGLLAKFKKTLKLPRT